MRSYETSVNPVVYLRYKASISSSVGSLPESDVFLGNQSIIINLMITIIQNKVDSPTSIFYPALIVIIVVIKMKQHFST